MNFRSGLFIPEKRKLIDFAVTGTPAPMKNSCPQSGAGDAGPLYMCHKPTFSPALRKPLSTRFFLSHFSSAFFPHRHFYSIGLFSNLWFI